MTGFCMRTAGEKLSPRRRFVLAAAGPAVNFLLAGVWALRLSQTTTIRGSAFWAANLLTGLFNLLPIPPLDGAQMAACAGRCGSKNTESMHKPPETIAKLAHLG